MIRHHQSADRWYFYAHLNMIKAARGTRRVLFLYNLFGVAAVKADLTGGWKTTENKPKEDKMAIFKVETLKEKGLTQEQIDYIMAEAGREVNAITAERDSYKSQLATTQKSLSELEGLDAPGMKVKIADLTKQIEGKDSEIEKIKSDYAFDAAIKEAIRKASGRSEKAIMALLDMDTLRASKNQAQDIAAALDGVKKENDYLFASGDDGSSRHRYVTHQTSGLDHDAQTRRDQANDALRSLYGKGE